MDFVEDATQSYLETLGLGEVVHEPLGRGTFPDFSIAGRIGVECTRLVKTLERDGEIYNVTEMEQSIVQRLENIISLVQFGQLQHSYFVGLRFRIDIDCRESAKELKRHLTLLSKSTEITPHKVRINSKLDVEIVPSSSRFNSPFVLGNYTNFDQGGWVLDQLILQTKNAINRKTTKASQKSNTFQEWWLAVSGDLTRGLQNEYLKTLRTELKNVDVWKKILLINSFSPQESTMLDLG